MPTSRAKNNKMKIKNVFILRILTHGPTANYCPTKMAFSHGKSARR